MEMIRVVTWINAPLERCFKLSLSFDLHVVLARSTGEEVVSGVQVGLLGLNNTISLRGRRFGLPFVHTTMIDAVRAPMYFREVGVEGMFSRFEHEHHFALMNDGTRMRDELRFSLPLAGRMLLRRHIVHLLKWRNAQIKWVAESQEWRRFLEEKTPMEPAADQQAGLANAWEQSAFQPR